MRHIFYRKSLLLFAITCLLLLAACGGSSSPGKATGQKAPAVTSTADQGQSLLAQSAHLLNTAQTLHGIFNATISGQLANGELDSEVWRMVPHKSRALVLKSTLNSFATGTLSVSDGKQMWQYDPAKKIVYSGLVGSSNATATPTPGGSRGNGQQLIYDAISMVFTNSAATLVSATDTVNGRPVYTIHVVPQTPGSTGSGSSFNYDGTVSIDQQSHLPVALDLALAGLGQAQITIPSLQLNLPLASDLFTFTPPPGTKVLPFPTATGQDGGSLTLAQAEQQAGYHLLSIPAAQSAYHLQSIDALGAPGNSIYSFTYTFNGLSFTLSQGRSLANLPLNSQQFSLRGTTATLSTNGGSSTLSWTEKGIGIQITGPLSQAQSIATANLLT
jgi:outer membrane lipoprotein-sorting protein